MQYGARSNLAPGVSMDLTPIIIATISAIVAVSSVVIQVRKDKHRTDADALAILEQSNARLAARLEQQAMKIDEMEALIQHNESIHQAQMAEIRAKYEKALLENDDLREWAERLVYQVRSFGNTEPVKMRVRSHE
jgi:hypothetical protein